MDGSQLEQAFRAFVDDVNAGTVEAARRRLARDFSAYRPGPDEPTAPDVWGAILDDLRGGLPDLRIEIEELRPSGEGVLTGRVSVRGTHTGPLWGAPPSGASVVWEPQVSVIAADDGLALNFDDVSPPEAIGLLRTLELVNPPDEMHLPPHHAESIVPEFLLRVLFNGQVADRPCSHLAEARVFDTDASVCQQCVASGDLWPSLRLCLVCGFVGCCDTSVNTHMKRHWEETGHALMRTIRLTERWIWCYPDNAFFDSRTLDRLRRQQAGSA